MTRMSTPEINELLALKGWSKRRLAAELSLTENTVYRWFIDRNPGAVANALLRKWLDEARLAGKTVEARPTFTKAEKRKIAEVRALLERLESSSAP